MHKNAEVVQGALLSLDCDGRVVELEESTGTASDAAQVIGVSVAQIAKSIVFLAGDNVVLVIVSGKNRVSLSRLAQYLGVPVSRASAQMVKDLTGFPVGGVAPVGHKSVLRTFVDIDLLKFSVVWAAAGTPYTVFQITPGELLRITRGEPLDLKE